MDLMIDRLNVDMGVTEKTSAGDDWNETFNCVRRQFAKNSPWDGQNGNNSVHGIIKVLYVCHVRRNLIKNIMK